MRRFRFLVVAVVLAAVPFAGCDQQSDGSTTISAETAARAAVAAAGSSVPPTVVSAELSTYVAADTPVWAVRVAGTFPLSCGPARASPGPCPPPATTKLILIDARSGMFIQGMTPAP
jgi:hypothetical protein